MYDNCWEIENFSTCEEISDGQLDNWYFDTDPHPIRGTYLHFHSVLKVISSLLLDIRSGDKSL